MLPEMSVSKLLSLLEKRGAKFNQNLYSMPAAGLFIGEPPERACIALKEMEIWPSRIKGNRADPNKEMIKILAVIETARDFDYFKCLTIGEFKEFLNNIKDKDELVCVVSPEDIQKGLCRPVIDAHETSDDKNSHNKRTREITGDNIFHLWT